MNNNSSNTIDFSFCIVWSPLPPITAILPFIGHMGICDSRGVVHDFQGPYYVGQNKDAIMAFGPTTRYLKINIGGGAEDDDGGGGGGGLCVTPERWDESILEADTIYRGRMHNICCDNCHSHVARALNIMPYGNTKWDMVKLCFLLFFQGRFVSMGAIAYQFLPFMIIVTLVLVFTRLT
jgi:hypothetical protein